MDNLRRALYGLSNSTTMTTINLSSFQDKRYGTRSKIDLAWLLEPLHNCPLRQLHLANNYLKEISPGLIQNTPLMEYVDVSHNQLGELGILSILSSPFFQETLLHKGLQEVDFSYQSPFTEEQSHELLYPNARFPDLESFTNRRKELSTAAFQERAAPLLPGDIDPEHWSQCTKYLASYSSQTCEIFSPNCRDTLDYLRRNHSQLCELVQVESYPYRSFAYRSYLDIPCSAIPTVDDIYQPNCLNCSVFTITGSVKHLQFNNLNIYEKGFNPIDTHMYPNLCFHHSNQLEYLDFSGNYAIVNYFLDQQFTVTGLKHVKVLNISNTGITSVFGNMLLNFPNLQVMDLSRNNITFDKERSVSLNSNTNIQFLNFSHNWINFVPQNFFSNLVSLRKLDLNNNSIHDFDFNISGLYSLENLNLENNQISEIPEATRKQLIQLTERIAPRIITVDLSNNQLSCSCSDIPFLSFMIQHKPTNLVFKNYDKYFCRNRADDRIRLYNLNLRSLWFDCLGSGVNMCLCWNYHHIVYSCDYLPKALVVPVSIFPGTPCLAEL